jgi:hypothetical protein
LPLEISEIPPQVTRLRVVALLVNGFAVVYLLWAKRLFGIRATCCDLAGGTARQPLGASLATRCRLKNTTGQDDIA